MKEDLDRLMESAGLDALFIVGGATHNPALAYFVGRAHLTHAELIKPRGSEPILFHRSMERDEAARTGINTQNINAYHPTELLKEAGGDPIRAEAARYRRMLEAYEVRGRVGIYGVSEVGPLYSTLKTLEVDFPAVELVGEPERTSVITRARGTKDEAEVNRIRRMGQVTVEVVGRTAEFLTSQRAVDSRLVDGEGNPVTIGAVKQQINRWLAELGAENPKGTIFAQGRDAGVPHSSGDDSAAVRIGEPIVFDLFPAEAGGGYFYDFTRTWCLGHASEDLLAVYDDVLAVYHEVYDALEADAACRAYQQMACERFEARGHPTVLSNPATEAGYVHSLGHGVGLAIHESPSFSHLESNDDRLSPGSVITFEPGLYYPERSIGVRLENTVWVRPGGAMETLVDYPMDLVLEMKKQAPR